MNKEEFFVKRIRELANTAYQRDIVTFSDFLGLNELNILNSLNFREYGVVPEVYGGYEYAERQMVAFHTDALAFPWKFPISCLKVEARSLKFSEELTHRDFLGALLNLGVDRAVIGDILVQDKTAWFFTETRMADFFMENLCRVKHTNIVISPVFDPGEMPRPKMEEITGTCSSVRLDSLIALAFQSSRSSMVPFIEEGRVYVNGKLVTSNGYEPKTGDIISVRGKGRFLFDGETHKTKKGRLGVRLFRYV
ncbi:MAG: YlmH/Sll1252 family protein [Blautia sp.]|nr:YlmH/Sll1252 family protein [Blautia sp.]MDY5031900.1 YlmH/Sll1252 family protein [Blautia sp.]